jgi:hypothetical protein
MPFPFTDIRVYQADVNVLRKKHSEITAYFTRYGARFRVRTYIASNVLRQFLDRDVHRPQEIAAASLRLCAGP